MLKKKIHYNTITPLLHKVLKDIMAAPEFNSFRLVGGTSLSLQMGHRESVDIDMFTDAFHGTVDFDAIDGFLRAKYTYVDTSTIKEVGFGKSYFVGNSKEDSVKLDIFYDESFIEEAITIDGVRMASTGEIAAMKLNVVSNGGRKKDFWDIHELKNDFTLKQMIELYQKRYPYTHDVDRIRMKLEDFSKADTDMDPVCLKKKRWSLIKLHIVDFSWADSPEIMKKEHQAIILNAGISFRLQVKEGIDYFNTLLYFKYDSSLAGNQIMMRLKNNTGETYSTPEYFNETGLSSRSLVSDWANDRLNDYTFQYIEFMSQKDIVFEFWVKEQEGGFMSS